MFILEVEPKGWCAVQCSLPPCCTCSEGSFCTTITHTPHTCHHPVMAVSDTESDPLVKSSDFQHSSSSSVQQWSRFSSHEAAVRIAGGIKCGWVHKCSINIRLFPFQPPSPLILSLYPHSSCFSDSSYIFSESVTLIYFRVPEEGLKSLFVRSCAVEAHKCPPLCR